MHIFYIDPLEKLTIKKDSSLLWACTLKGQGHEVYLLFKEDLYYATGDDVFFPCYDFSYEFMDDQIYLKSVTKNRSQKIKPHRDLTFYWRLDPPVNQDYFRKLWMIDSLKSTYHFKVSNDARGILQFNEKLLAYGQKKHIPSFIGSNKLYLNEFIEKNPHSHYIIKPLDLYQGIGVERVAAEDLNTVFTSRVKEEGVLIIQPYLKSVESGEIRSIYYKSREVGSIIKTPPEGSILANIAQGAEFKKIELSSDIAADCQRICKELAPYGLDLIAFDILGGLVSEVNITCPGLMTEVSFAHRKNLILSF